MDDKNVIPPEIGLGEVENQIVVDSNLKPLSAQELEIYQAIQRVFRPVMKETMDAIKTHEPFNSAHEAYAVLKEEVDELWDEIKINQLINAKKECVQVCAMALRFLIDVGDKPLRDDPVIKALYNKPLFGNFGEIKDTIGFEPSNMTASEILKMKEEK